MPWQTPWAPTATELNACIECGLCLPHCPTYRLTGDETASPRGRLNAMSAVASGDAVIDETFAEIMSFCLQCRACEPACPSLVPFGRAMEGARAEVAWSLATPGHAVRRTVLGALLPRRWVMRIATQAARLAQRFALSRGLPPSVRRGLLGLRPLGDSAPSIGGVFEPEGTAIAEVGLLAGCVMDEWFGEVHAATIRVLTEAGYRVVVPGAQKCCGALAAHDGAAPEAERLAGANVQAFERFDIVVSDAAGCSAHLKQYQHWADGGESLGSKTRDVTELVAQALVDGRLPHLPATSVEVAVQDPCHLRHAQRVVAEPRDIISAAGFRPVDIDEVGMCCGAAGIYSLLRPDTSSELGRKKAVEVTNTGAGIVASANPGCEMQLRTYLDGDIEVVHPVELYARALDRFTQNQ